MRAWIKTKIVVKHFCTAMETFLSCGLICISAIVLFISYLYLSSRGLPHGPWMWPFLGINAFSDNKKLILFLKNLERKYGSIFRFRLGTRHVTVVGGLENIQHVLGQDSVQPYHHWSQFITKNHEPQGISIWICILHFFLLYLQLFNFPIYDMFNYDTHRKIITRILIFLYKLLSLNMILLSLYQAYTLSREMKEAP